VNDEKYIGLTSIATIVVAVLDSTGKLVMESILKPKRRRFFSSSPACVELCQ
jgi:hypothetical protein